jgi:hypothetical protein
VISVLVEKTVTFTRDGETRTQAELIEGADRWFVDWPTGTLRRIVGGVTEDWKLDSERGE